eukprot:1084609-Alexandrium_andersonii.AAC.1
MCIRDRIGVDACLLAAVGCAAWSCERVERSPPLFSKRNALRLCVETEHHLHANCFINWGRGPIAL